MKTVKWLELLRSAIATNVIKIPPNMATPPKLGTGMKCTFLLPGKSNTFFASANFITNGKTLLEMKKDTNVVTISKSI
ncbi:MAG: hypothetical protein K9I92_02330, partial [Chitinophagaceae bacterium]|nr:hypothetical protein [Chitinophagaceae bacterium]